MKNKLKIAAILISTSLLSLTPVASISLQAKVDSKKEVKDRIALLQQSEKNQEESEELEEIEDDEEEVTEEKESEKDSSKKDDNKQQEKEDSSNSEEDEDEELEEPENKNKKVILSVVAGVSTALVLAGLGFGIYKAITDSKSKKNKSS